MNSIIRITCTAILLSANLLAANISIEQAVEQYLKTNMSVSNNNIDLEIQDIRKNSMEQQAKQNPLLEISPTYDSKIGDVLYDAKLSYNEYYFILKYKNDTIIDNATRSAKTQKVFDASLGFNKNINEYFFDPFLSKKRINEIETAQIKEKYIATIESDINSIFSKFLTVKSLENTIKTNLDIIVVKQKDLEAAEIRLKDGKISKQEVELIKINIQNIQTQNDVTKVQYSDAIKELKYLIGNTEEQLTLEEFPEVKNYDIYVNNTNINLSELDIERAEETMKSYKNSNLPQANASMGYSLNNNQWNASVTVRYYPFDYKENEKEQEKNIVKLKAKLEDEKSKVIKNRVTEENAIKILELKVKVSEWELKSLKMELDKSEILYKEGTISENDYFTKQNDYKNKEIEYKNNENNLKAEKIKNNLLLKITKIN